MAATTEEKHRRIQQWQSRGDDGAVENLVRTLLHDHDPDVRGAVAAAMGKMGSGGKPVKSLMIEALGRAVADEESHVRIKAVEALGRIGGEHAAHCLVQALQNRQSAERMLAAERLNRSLAEEAFADEEEKAATDKARGDAWDLQWSAAQALAKIGLTQAVGPLIAWAERLLISDVRVMSAEEKSELIRAVLGGIFRKLESGQIYDLSSALDPAVPVYSWEQVNKADRIFGWIHAKRANPIWVLFQDEMNRRKADYMKSLNARDTLFQPGEGAAGAAQANAKDTLFAPIGGGGASANAKDTLFSAISPSEAPSEEISFGGAAEAQADRRKAELLRSLGKHDQSPLARHASSGPAPSKPAEPQMSEEEIERRRAEYAKTLGAQDSLFLPMEMKPAAMRGGEDADLFPEAPAEAEPPKAAAPAKPPASATPEQAERLRRASLAAADDELRDTLFQPIPAKVSALSDEEKRRQAALAAEGEPKDTLFHPIPAVERPAAPEPAKPAPAKPAEKKAPPPRRRRGLLARLRRAIKFIFGGR